MTTLEDLYKHKFTANSASVVPHMPTLMKLASNCEVCVEFGVRRGHTTVALLCGTPGKLYSWEIEPLPQFHKPIQKAAGDKWVLTYGRSEEAQFETCDLLFHDSFHNYGQVKRELDAHGHKARKFIAFHDTYKYGNKGSYDSMPGDFDPNDRGMLPAIFEWLLKNPQWVIHSHVPYGDGLLVLERKP